MKYPIICILFFFLHFQAHAQNPAKDSIPSPLDSSVSPWSYGAEVFYYMFPDQENITNPTAYADYNSLHLLARYNYEDINTASIFGGYRLEGGRKIEYGFTPMLGIVFGNTNGIAPGMEIEITWKKIDFYSETEYVYDFEKKENNFLYTWSELGISPFKNFRTGISANRTRLYQSDLELQRAVFIQYTLWKITAGVHYYNPFTSDNFLIATLSIDF